jgi:hypothetical protein
LVLTCTVVVSAGSNGPQTRDTSERAVVRAAAGYIAEYQRQLTSIVADETYTQEVAAQSPRDPQMTRVRQMRSEVFFMYVARDHHWMAVRDVTTVDGKSISDRPDFRAALQKLAPDEAAARFKEYNSRYNIGRTFRNFNEPTLALLILDEHHRERFSFDRKRVERAGDSLLVTLAFAEKESPTLIFDPKRGRVFSKGEFTVEAGTGRVKRSVLSAKVDALRLELTTTFAPDARLGIWVPTLFREEYEYGTESKSNRLESTPDYEHVVCEAQYSNFRRFETTARIK